MRSLLHPTRYRKRKTSPAVDRRPRLDAACERHGSASHVAGSRGLRTERSLGRAPGGSVSPRFGRTPGSRFRKGFGKCTGEWMAAEGPHGLARGGPAPRRTAWGGGPAGTLGTALPANFL